MLRFSSRLTLSFALFLLNQAYANVKITHLHNRHISYTHIYVSVKLHNGQVIFSLFPSSIVYTWLFFSVICVWSSLESNRNRRAIQKSNCFPMVYPISIEYWIRFYESKTIVIVQFSWWIFYLVMSDLMLDKQRKRASVCAPSRVTCDYRGKSYSQSAFFFFNLWHQLGLEARPVAKIWTSNEQRQRPAQETDGKNVMLDIENNNTDDSSHDNDDDDDAKAIRRCLNSMNEQ